MTGAKLKQKDAVKKAVEVLEVFYKVAEMQGHDRTIWDKTQEAISALKKEFGL